MPVASARHEPGRSRPMAGPSRRIFDKPRCRGRRHQCSGRGAAWPKAKVQEPEMSRGCPHLPPENKLESRRLPRASWSGPASSASCQLWEKKVSGCSLRTFIFKRQTATEADIGDRSNLMDGSCNNMAPDFSQFDCRCKALMAPSYSSTQLDAYADARNQF